jgi:hypothetical protein
MGKFACFRVWTVHYVIGRAKLIAVKGEIHLELSCEVRQRVVGVGESVCVKGFVRIQIGWCGEPVSRHCSLSYIHLR